MVSTSPTKVNAIIDPLTLSVATQHIQAPTSSTPVSSIEDVNIEPSLVPETPFTLYRPPLQSVSTSQRLKANIGAVSQDSINPSGSLASPKATYPTSNDLTSPSQTVSTATFIRPSVVPETPFIAPSRPQTLRVNLSAIGDIDSCDFMSTVVSLCSSYSIFAFAHFEWWCIDF